MQFLQPSLQHSSVCLACKFRALTAKYQGYEGPCLCTGSLDGSEGAQAHVLDIVAIQNNYDLFIGSIEDVIDPTKEEHVLMLDDPPTQKSVMVEEKAKALHYVKVPSM